MLWTQKYAPKTTKDVVGQDAALSAAKMFISHYPHVKKKALLLHGSPGTGKTCSVHALAREMDCELVEVNASDTRNADALQTILGAASKQRSLFAKGKIILVDELDGLAGMDDRGGVGALVKIIDDSVFPLILTTADPYDRKIKDVKKKCEVVEFVSLPVPALVQFLSRIAMQENITAPEALLKILTRRAGGDARAAITDFQSLTEQTKTLSKEDINTLGERIQRESILKGLMKIFKTTDISIAAAALDSIEEDLDEVFLWVDENLPKEYKKPHDIVRAYEAVSKADIYSSRIRRWQYWRLLVYVRFFLTVGVALAKDAKYEQFVPYKPTQRLLTIWRLNMKNAKKKSIAEKIAAATHCGTREAMKVVPYFRSLCKNATVAEELGLTEEEKEWIHP